MIQAPDSLENVEASIGSYAQVEAGAPGYSRRKEAPSAPELHSVSALLAQPRLYLPQLDGLRTFAFLLVFGAHAGTISPANPQLPTCLIPLAEWYQNLTWYGWTGVDLFLVLSAFLITTLLIREEQQFGSIDPKLFLIRRVLRIWPVYFFAVITGLLLYPIITFPAVAKFGTARYWEIICIDAPWFFAFALNIGVANAFLNPPANLTPLWSISLEEQFYVFWACFFKAVRRVTTRYAALAAMLVGTICVRSYLQHVCPAHTAFYQNTLSRLDPLIFGATFAFILQLHPNIRNLNAKYGWLALAVSLLLLNAAMIVDPYPFVKAYFNPFCFTMIDFGWALFVVALTGLPFLIKAFSNKHLVAFGKLTYGMYVFHAAVLEALIRFIYHPLKMDSDCIWRPLINWGLGLPLTFLVAWIVWNIFEKRIYLLKFKYSPVPSGHN